MEPFLEFLVSPFTITVAVLVILLVIITYRIFLSPFYVLSRHGIPGPKPLPFWGNYLDFRKKGLSSFLDQQYKKYGQHFGFYIGCQPRIVIADPELLKLIMVKHFDSFTDRGFIGSVNIGTEMLGSQGLLAEVGDMWKTARHTLTPAFSGLKMKIMVPLIERSSTTLVEKLGEYAESGEAAELFRMYGRFTMETLVTVAFGRYIALQNGEASQLTDAAATIFRAQLESDDKSPEILLLILSNFPWIGPLLGWMLRRDKAIVSFYMLRRTALTLVRERMKSNQSSKIKDLLQLMVDATVEEEGNKNGGKKLTDVQIVGYSIDFLLAGYETTANTLSFTSYLLALHPDIQQRLQSEIDNYFEENPEKGLYEASQAIQYLDMTLQESMRFYTPVPKTQRSCSNTIKIGDVVIPKGAEVVIPINMLHHSPEYWPEPGNFDPERFSAEEKIKRPQLAHMPFGWGPRNCIGMRFALLQAKIALITILQKYSFVKCPETEANLQISSGITQTPKNGVFVKLEARN